MILRKKIFAGVLVGAMAFTVLSGCSSQATTEVSNSATSVVEEGYKVGVIQLVEHASLDEANRGFADGLAEAGYIDGENITLIQHNAQGDQANLQNIAQQLISNNVDLICAIATPSAQIAANGTTTIPIVGTAITDYVEAKLVASNEEPGGNITGTTDMNPIVEQVDLLMQFIPEAKIIGTIYSSSEINSQIQVDIMKAYAESRGLEVKIATISSVNDIQQAATNLVNSGVEGIYVPTDNMIASAMPSLSKITEPAKLPVVAGATAMVDDGALATLGVDYYKLGVQTGAMAARILSGEASPATMPIESSHDLNLVINEETAEHIGIIIPAELAARLH